ncbi:hypothetical protein V500_00316 [Pseudogymnoascus sp. VKM F-4518 (FW-2643)]|nr:hypothetical protein V500_00316 [Pseudogymnoascus sp. VKM F-4518 (FW-2643)]
MAVEKYAQRSGVALMRSCRKPHLQQPFYSIAAASYHKSTPRREPATPVVESPTPKRIPTYPVDAPESPPQKFKPSRFKRLQEAAPFSSFLTDNFYRQHDYLRISITEKCNLRCLYCMPEEGVPQSPPSHLLTTPEIVLLSELFVSQGVTKIRLTGGEPTVRKDIVPMMQQIGQLRGARAGREGLKDLCLTTNGISLWRKLDPMVEAGLTGINLSLDTLDPYQFQIMTRRKGFDAVQRSIDRILEMNALGAGIKLKINCVVMRGLNDREILDFVELGREKDIEVRFIEYMPFDGNKWSEGKMLPFQEMLDRIKEKYPGVEKVQDHKNDTSKTYRVSGFVGKFGFITSMTHNFCGTCNRLRITSDGNLKVCLFGNDEVSLRDILRENNLGNPIDEEAFEAMKKIEMDRREGRVDGTLGMLNNESKLLDVIGIAVKGKKEKHAGMGELKDMKNRPMILIDSPEVAKWNPLRANNQLHLYDMQPTARSASARRHVPLHLLTSYPRTFLRHYHAKNRLPKPYSILSPLRAPGTYNQVVGPLKARMLSSTDCLPAKSTPKSPISPTSAPRLTHLTPSGSAHMVDISAKDPTSRSATAVCSLYFSNATAAQLIAANQMKKGDVLSVARIAGIMGAKRTSDLVPLCHPLFITRVQLDLELVPGEVSTDDGVGQDDHGRIDIKAIVDCEGKTGVEMEALTAASVASLTVYDMCKAVDKGMRIEGLRVVRKEGGKSGTWIEGKGV